MVIIGKTGRNFAAGMSGGIAYVYDQEGSFKDYCNLEMVALEAFESEEERLQVQSLLKNHLEYTGSSVAARILNGWEVEHKRFVKVMPCDYRRVLEEQRRRARSGSAAVISQAAL